ncbi:MAG: diguanylate cyclase [Burkholderiales bacterium]
MGAMETLQRERSVKPVASAVTTSAGASVMVSPAVLARATFRRLAERRLVPTPSNYAAIYAELSGEEPANSPFAEGMGTTQKSVDNKPVDSRPGDLKGDAVESAERWGELIRDLIRSWESRNPDWTQARKRESLDHVAMAFRADDDKLAARLRGLVNSWSAKGAGARGALLVEEEINPPVAAITRVSGVSGDAVIAPGATAKPVANIAVGAAQNIPPVVVRATPPTVEARGAIEACALLRDLAVDLLLFAVGESDGAGVDQRLVVQSGKLIESLRVAADPAQLAALAPKIRTLMRRADQVRGSRREMLQSLLGLLHLIVSNIEELVPDERWVKGQVARLRDLIGEPLDGGSLAEAQKAFREIIVKQSSIKQGIREAQGAMKEMLASFIGRLSSMSESTGQYQSKVENYAEQIRGAEDIESLSAVVRTLLEDTRLAQADILRGRDELVSAQHRAREYEDRVLRLERELSDVSSLLREDPLTGVLNRRGLAEAFAVESARSDRAELPLCAALLDVDNFKKLNDTHGHDAGDRALQHLADIVREAIRPTDVVARFGGEEFVVLMPLTAPEEAVQIMTRVQRHLTRGFYLDGNKKMLITFSAGVTRRVLDEEQAAVLARADQALYEAKATGKNKVIFI